MKRSSQDVGRLRSAGLRVTAPRLAVLGQLRAGGHPTVEEITRRVRGQLGSLSVQAVYDALAAFEEHGLVRRIEPMGSAMRYESRVGDNHHHLVCRGCGSVVDVDCAVGTAPCLTPSDDHGFAVDEADVTFWGRCPSCQAAGAQAPVGAVAGGTAGSAAR